MAKTKIIQPYVNVPYIPLNEVDNTQRNGAQFFRNVKELSVGFGAQVFRVDRNGMWAGAETFAAAPWSVDWQGNMVASSITLSGYVPTGGALDDIGLGGITAGYINVSSLSAISANIGSVTSGTITGALIRTSATGSRVEIDGSTDDIQIFDSGNDLRMKLDSNELGFYNTNGVRIGYIETPSTTNFRIATPTGNAMILDAEGTNILDGIFLFANGVQKAVVTTDGVTFNDRVSCVDRVAPATDSTEDLGSPSLLWDDIYVNEVNYNTLTSLSDHRMKENIEALGAGLESILALRPVSFQYKRKENKINKKNKAKHAHVEAKMLKKAAILHLGFIAQEVENILPQLVNSGTDTEMATIRTTEMIAVIVKAIQELNQKIEDHLGG